MKASYTHSIIAVNSIHRPAGKVVRTPLRSPLFICAPQRGSGSVTGRRFAFPVRTGLRTLSTAERPAGTIPRVSSSREVSGGVRVIRSVAIILVAVQALLPPGMCLCQIVSFGVTTPQAHETAHPTSITDDKSCCSCAACRVAAPAATPLLADQQIATDREAPDEHNLLPTPSAPCSGCPVVAAGPAARVAVLPATEQAPLDPAVPFVVLTDEATPHRATRPNLFFAPAAPPLFVRYCAFLI